MRSTRLLMPTGRQDEYASFDYLLLKEAYRNTYMRIYCYEKPVMNIFEKYHVKIPKNSPRISRQS